MTHTVAPSSRTRIGRLLVVILFFLAIFCVGVVLALPWLVNRPASMAALLQQFEERTGYRITIEQSQVQLFPSPRLTWTNPRLYDAASTTPLALAERVEIALQWLPLLEGRIVATDLVIDRPHVTVRRGPNGTWSLGQERSPAAASDSTRSFGLLQVVRNLLVVQGTVTVVDESTSASGPLHLTVAQGALSSEMMGRRARLYLPVRSRRKAGAQRSCGKARSHRTMKVERYRQKEMCDSTRSMRVICCRRGSAVDGSPTVFRSRPS